MVSYFVLMHFLILFLLYEERKGLLELVILFPVEAELLFELADLADGLVKLDGELMVQRLRSLKLNLFINKFLPQPLNFSRGISIVDSRIRFIRALLS